MGKIIIPPKSELEQGFLDEAKLRNYQRALSLFIREIYRTKERVIVTLDGRDTAGKGYTLTNITRYLNNNRFKTIFFGKPTDEEKKSWQENPEKWFARYSQYFPEEGKITFFDRSWYNRALVEVVMGFCSKDQYQWFMENVNQFESNIKNDFDAKLTKIYLSVSKKIQKQRLDKRKDPLTNWKVSPVDQAAQEKWDQYTWAKRQMIQFTNTPENPWHIIDSNKRIEGVIEAIKTIILSYPELAQFIKDELRGDQEISLKMNPKIYRSGEEELVRMTKKGQKEEVPSIIRV